MDSRQRLVGAGSRSAPVAVRGGRPSALHFSSKLHSVKLQDLVPQVRRRRRKGVVEVLAEEEEFDPALGFWRSPRLIESQIPPELLQDEPAEYFISHVWQPRDQAQSRDNWAEEKTSLLKWWASCRKTLGDDRGGRCPWFLLDSDQERREALLDPTRAWHNMRCWVDKACAHRGFAAGCPPQEAIRASKDAIANCHTFVAMVSHAGFFRRLWCSFELAFFVTRVAPHYRQAEFLLPDAMLEPAALEELAQSAAAFSLPSLLASGTAQRAELRREMEALQVDEKGFETFLRSVLLALLGLSILLRCGEGCAAFTGGTLEAISEASWAADLRGLSKVLSTAQPGVWWRTAYRHVRRRAFDERHQIGDPTVRRHTLDSEDDLREEHDVSEGEAEVEENDPLEMLANYVNQKFFGGARGTPKVEIEVPEFAEEGEEEEQKEVDPVVDVDGEVGEEGEDEDEAVAQPACTPREAGDFAAHVCKITAAAKGPNAHALESVMELARHGTDEATRLPSVVEQVVEEEEEAAEQAVGPEVTDVPSGPMRGAEESNAWKCVLARSGLAIPPGFEEFWHGATGEPMEADARAHARIFFESWQMYRRRVCKWFDAKVVPQLEFWRQRGVRSSGVLEEAFRDVFMQVGGSVQDDLHEQLHATVEAPCQTRMRAESKDTAEQQPPVWTNPALGRLLVLSRRQETFRNHRFAGGADEDLSRLPAILVSDLPLQLAEEPSVSVVCAKPLRGPGWRRSVALQELGSDALTAAAYQLLINFTTEGCTTEGVDLEVLIPRLVLQVRGGKHQEVVCGLRLSGRLEVRPETPHSRPQTHQTVAGDAAVDVEVASPAQGENDSSGSSSDTETAQDDGVDWSSWLYHAYEKEGSAPSSPAPSRPAQTSPKTAGPLPKTPRAVVTEIHRPESRGEGASPGRSPGALKHRSRKWWPEPKAAAEKLLPRSARGLPQKLPLIRELRLWRPAADVERGLERSWRTPRRPSGSPGLWDTRCLDATRLPATECSMPAVPPVTHALPMSARLKSTDAWKLRTSKWLWRYVCEGGPREPSQMAEEEESVGSLQYHFEQLYRFAQRTGFAQWVALNAAADAQARPMKSRCYTGGGGSLLPPQLAPGKESEDPQSLGSSGAPSPLDASDPCDRCKWRCLAALPLEGSLLRHIWESEVCVVCLRCGFFRPDNGETRAQSLADDEVLEVTTSVLLRPGEAEAMQRCVSRVLRVESGVCCVAMVKEASSDRPTRAVARVASVSFGVANASFAAAATVTARSDELDLRERRSRPFAQDQNWITSSLADTGLDLFYGKVRDLSVDVAVEELDDLRMLRLRKQMCPLALWLELAYVLSPDFNLIRWNRALAEVFGTLKLTAAVLMRMNISRLRQMTGLGKLQDPDSPSEVPSRLAWPLGLHRVMVARRGSAEALLATAMQGSGIREGSVAEMREKGKQLQEAHFEAVEAELEKEVAEGKQDVGKVTVATIMTVLSKTRSAFGDASSRALLQARRILRRKQVFLFLRELHTTIVVTGQQDETALLRSSTHNDGDSDVSEDSVSLEDEEEDADVDPLDEDLMIHAPRDSNSDLRVPLSGLTIIKVLGHFREYVHFSQMVFMSVQVLGVMMRSAIRLNSKSATSVNTRDRRRAQPLEMEQVMLRHGFVESSMRALYRHASNPEIAREVLLMLKWMVRDDAGHDESSKAQSQLLSPPERPMTLVLAMSKLSGLQDRANLLLSLEVYASLGPLALELASSPLPSLSPSLQAAEKKGSSRRCSRTSAAETPLRLPPQREAEAAEVFVTVLRAHWEDEAITLLMLQIIQFSCEQPALCRHLFTRRLTSELRRFLRHASTGEVEEAWFEEMKKRTGMALRGNSKSSSRFKKMKELAEARARVVASIALAESCCWQLLFTLAVNTAGAQGASKRVADLEAHPNYRRDAAKCVHQALVEMERHGSQWTLAVQYLEAMLLFDLPSHGECFEEEEGLQLILAEFPDGKVSEVFPLMAALLRLHLRTVSEATEQHVLSDDEEDQVFVGRSASLPKPEIPRPPEPPAPNAGKPLKGKAKTRPVAARRQTLPAPDASAAGEFVMITDRLLARFKAILTKHGAISSLLSSLLHRLDSKLQDGLLRVLADLLQDKACGGAEAAKEFLNFGADGENTGPRILLALLNGHLNNADRVTTVLYALAGAMKLNPGVAEGLATQLGAKLLIETVWLYRTCKSKRRRALALLRKMRDADPLLTATMLRRWKVHLAQVEMGEEVKEAATSPSPSDEEGAEQEDAETEEAPARSQTEQAVATAPSPVLAERGATMPGGLIQADATGEEEQEQLQVAEEPVAEEALPEASEMLAVAGDSPEPQVVTQLEAESALSVDQDPLHAEEERSVAEPDQQSRGPTPAQDVPKAVLPREMRHFLALLKVHRFEQKSSILAIPDVVQAIVDFGDDPELALCGIRSLMSGVPLEQEMRFPTIGRCPDFAAALRRILLREQSSEGLLLMLRLVYGILDNDPADYQGWVEVAARGISKVLDASTSWTSTGWEVLLKSINETMGTPQGRNRLFELSTYHSLEKAWEWLKTSDETMSKMLVASYHDQTERTLELLS